MESRDWTGNEEEWRALHTTARRWWKLVEGRAIEVRMLWTPRNARFYGDLLRAAYAERANEVYALEVVSARDECITWRKQWVRARCRALGVQHALLEFPPGGFARSR